MFFVLFIKLILLSISEKYIICFLDCIFYIIPFSIRI